MALLRSLLEAALFLEAGDHVALIAGTVASISTSVALELASTVAAALFLVSAVFLDKVLKGHVLVIHFCSSDF